MRTILLLLCTLLAFNAYPQEVKRPDTYNYNRAMDAISDDSYQEALEYLNKEVNENSKNGYAFVWISILRNEMEEYGKALTAINLGIKHLPKKDATFLAIAYRTRSEIYIKLDEIDKAIEDISTAIRHEPENEDLYKDRGDLHYYYTNDYSLSDKDYAKIVELNAGSVLGYMGIGRNANAQGRYTDAIKQFDYVIRMHSGYSSGYSFRAESYIGLQKYNEAVNDVIQALEIDGDDKAYHLMYTLADSAFTLMTTKLKVQHAKKPLAGEWPFYLGAIYERESRYDEAIASYKKSIEIEQSEYCIYRIANCLDELGRYEEALQYCEQAISIDPDDEDYIMLKAIIEDNAGMSKEAIADMNHYISMRPDYYGGYYRRGWIKDHCGELKGAIEDYTVAITLNPNYAYSYLNRGILYNLQGNTTEAASDFEQVILLDTIPKNNSSRQYAYCYLGQTENAVKWMDKILEKNDNVGNYYDAACLYSVMGEKEKSLSYLREALQKGYRRFAHIDRDRDLNNIRELPEYKILIEEFVQKHKKEQSATIEEEYDYVDKTTEIPFVSEGGVYKVRCAINDLPLHFIFDTGASDVSMSTVEATFMLKNNYLSSQDIIGKQNFMTATGEISEGTIINLRSVSFGGLDLKNIKASVVKSQNAPLLLGQSVLNKLGTIEIDNQKRVLKVIYKQKR